MVLVTANPSGNSRTGTITLAGGGVSATVNVTQVAASTTYYSKSTGDLSSVSTYGTGTEILEHHHRTLIVQVQIQFTSLLTAAIML